MKCPYTVNSLTKRRWQYDYDDDNGLQNDAYELEEIKQTMIECEKENCGAWYDGRCHYKD